MQRSRSQSGEKLPFAPVLQFVPSHLGAGGEIHPGRRSGVGGSSEAIASDRSEPTAGGGDDVSTRRPESSRVLVTTLKDRQQFVTHALRLCEFSEDS